jgi:hypothetical protein
MKDIIKFILYYYISIYKKRIDDYMTPKYAWEDIKEFIPNKKYGKNQIVTEGFGKLPEPPDLVIRHSVNHRDNY